MSGSPGGLSVATDGPVAAVGGEAPIAERSHRMYPCEAISLSETRLS